MNPPHTDPHRQHYGLTLLVLVSAALAYTLSQTMVIPALPAIQQDLGSSGTTTTFVLTAFLVSNCFGDLGIDFRDRKFLTIRRHDGDLGVTKPLYRFTRRRPSPKSARCATRPCIYKEFRRVNSVRRAEL